MPKKPKQTVIKDLKDIPGAEKAPGELPAMDGPGVEKLRLPLLDKQAEKVSGLCEKRKQLAENEATEREVLLGMMDEHKLFQYQLDDGRVVYVDDKRKAKIKSSITDDND